MKAEESSTFWPVPPAVGPTVERFASAGLVIVLVIFMLIHREDLRNRLIRLIGYGRLTFTTKALEEAGDADKPLPAHADDHQCLLWFSGGFGIFSDWSSLCRPLGFSCCRVAFHSLCRTLCGGDHAERP